MVVKSGVVSAGAGGCASSEQSTISSGNSQPFMTSPFRMLSAMTMLNRFGLSVRPEVLIGRVVGVDDGVEVLAAAYGDYPFGTHPEHRRRDHDHSKADQFEEVLQSFAFLRMATQRLLPHAFSGHTTTMRKNSRSTLRKCSFPQSSFRD
jgi:hypothetical protein